MGLSDGVVNSCCCASVFGVTFATQLFPAYRRHLLKFGAGQDILFACLLVCSWRLAFGWFYPHVHLLHASKGPTMKLTDLKKAGLAILPELLIALLTPENNSVRGLTTPIATWSWHVL